MPAVVEPGVTGGTSSPSSDGGFVAICDSLSPGCSSTGVSALLERLLCYKRK